MEINLSLFLVIVVVVLIVGCLAIIKLPKFLSHIIARHITKDAGDLGAAIVELDDIINDLRSRLAKMVPNQQYEEIKAKIPQMETQLKTLQNTLAQVERELATQKGIINNKESLHNEIKKGRAESIKLADELIANKEILLNEMSLLQDQLADSKAQLDSLNEEVELTDAQKSALADIKTSLDSTVGQLNELAVAYGQISKSFVTLEGQYKELEKEYRRLIEVELSRHQ
ncbi:MAG: hypothetical protein IT292_10030 [Deltaproteobacteria bacterium]|nr:hypothetical protein [Deltaproteobacteria bacterium]